MTQAIVKPKPLAQNKVEELKDDEDDFVEEKEEDEDKESESEKMEESDKNIRQTSNDNGKMEKNEKEDPELVENNEKMETETSISEEPYNDLNQSKETTEKPDKVKVIGPIIPKNIDIPVNEMTSENSNEDQLNPLNRKRNTERMERRKVQH